MSCFLQALEKTLGESHRDLLDSLSGTCTILCKKSFVAKGYNWEQTQLPEVSDQFFSTESLDSISALVRMTFLHVHRKHLIMQFTSAKLTRRRPFEAWAFCDSSSAYDEMNLKMAS